MRWYISYPILAAGLAFGFETFYPAQSGVSVSPAVATHALPDPLNQPIVVMASETSDEFGSRVGAFSPGVHLVAASEPVQPSAPTESSSVLGYLAQALTPAEDEPVPPTPQRVTLAEWKSAIVRAPDTTRVAEASEPISRDALTRDIQRELQRVGCYLGEIDGIWGGGSKRAVLMFMDRVNAALPTRDPDVFMLSLVKAQSSSVCGASCPLGQSLTPAGRCMPSTLVAHADEAGPSSDPSLDETWAPAVAHNAERAPPPFGRMSIGGPKPGAVQELSAGWSRVTSTTAPSAPMARTAALEVTGADDPAASVPTRSPDVARSSFDADAIAEPQAGKRSRTSADRPKARRDRPRYTSSYRQVQHLFQHPLGRM